MGDFDNGGGLSPHARTHQLFFASLSLSPISNSLLFVSPHTHASTLKFPENPLEMGALTKFCHRPNHAFHKARRAIVTQMTHRPLRRSSGPPARLPRAPRDTLEPPRNFCSRPAPTRSGPGRPGPSQRFGPKPDSAIEAGPGPPVRGAARHSLCRSRSGRRRPRRPPLFPDCRRRRRRPGSDWGIRPERPPRGASAGAGPGRCGAGPGWGRGDTAAVRDADAHYWRMEGRAGSIRVEPGRAGPGPRPSSPAAWRRTPWNAGRPRRLAP